MMSTFRLIMALLLFFLAILVLIPNWVGTITAIRNRRKGIDRGYSQIPFFSLIFCLAAIVLYPSHPKWWLSLPAILDPGTWVLLYLPVFIVKEWLFTKGPNEKGS